MLSHFWCFCRYPSAHFSYLTEPKVRHSIKNIKFKVKVNIVAKSKRQTRVKVLYLHIEVPYSAPCPLEYVHVKRLQPISTHHLFPDPITNLDPGYKLTMTVLVTTLMTILMTVQCTCARIPTIPYYFCRQSVSLSLPSEIEILYSPEVKIRKWFSKGGIRSMNWIFGRVYVFVMKWMLSHNTDFRIPWSFWLVQSWNTLSSTCIVWLSGSTSLCGLVLSFFGLIRKTFTGWKEYSPTWSFRSHPRLGARRTWTHLHNSTWMPPQQTTHMSGYTESTMGTTNFTIPNPQTETLIARPTLPSLLIMNPPF